MGCELEQPDHEISRERQCPALNAGAEMQVAQPVPYLTQSLGEGPALVFIFLAQPSAADIGCVGRGQGNWRKSAYLVRLWRGRAATEAAVRLTRSARSSSLKAAAVTSQHSSESTVRAAHEGQKAAQWQL